MKVVKLAVRMEVSGRMREVGEIVVVPDDFNHGTVAETIKTDIDKQKEEENGTGEAQ